MATKASKRSTAKAKAPDVSGPPPAPAPPKTVTTKAFVGLNMPEDEALVRARKRISHRKTVSESYDPQDGFVTFEEPV